MTAFNTLLEQHFIICHCNIFCNAIEVGNDDTLCLALLLLHYIQLVNVCSFNISLLLLFLPIRFLSLLSPSLLLPLYHKTPSNPNVPPRTPRLTPRHSVVIILYNNIETLFL